MRDRVPAGLFRATVRTDNPVLLEIRATSPNLDAIATLAAMSSNEHGLLVELNFPEHRARVIARRALGHAGYAVQVNRRPGQPDLVGSVPDEPRVLVQGLRPQPTGVGALGGVVGFPGTSRTRGRPRLDRGHKHRSHRCCRAVSCLPLDSVDDVTVLRGRVTYRADRDLSQCPAAERGGLRPARKVGLVGSAQGLQRAREVTRNIEQHWSLL